MKRIIILGMLIINELLSCSSSKKAKNVGDGTALKARDLQIVFQLNHQNYSYKFKILNKSGDKISILIPKIYGANSYFKLLDSNFQIYNRRCATIKYSTDGLDFIDLLPNVETTLQGDLTLEDYFCLINESDFLSFFYYGMYKAEHNGKFENGTFSFEIQPTLVRKIDSLVMVKKLF